LSEEQIEEIEKARVVTLSRDQWENLQNIAPTFPRRIGVASPFVELISDSKFSLWPDQVHGIWFSRTEIAIPRASADGTGGYRGFNKRLSADEAVLIDTHGNYRIGPRATSLEKLVKSLDALEERQARGVTFNLFILRPPVLPAEEEAKVEASVARLEALCRERGFAFHLGG
jgi:hypothetical protein